MLSDDESSFCLEEYFTVLHEAFTLDEYQISFS